MSRVCVLNVGLKQLYQSSSYELTIVFLLCGLDTFQLFQDETFDLFWALNDFYYYDFFYEYAEATDCLD